MITTYLLKSEQIKNPAILDLVKKTIRTHSTKAVKALKITKPVNITVYFNPDWTIHTTGENGYTPTGEWVQISLDLTGKKFPVKTVIEKRLPATIYHELCHIKRWQTTGFGSVFREELVSEGLACAFEVEQFKHDIEPLFMASEAEIKKMISVVKKNRDRIKNEYSYFEWFTVGSKKVPRWLGYKLGYYIITQVLEKNPELSVADLMDMSAQKLYKMSKIDLDL